MHSHIPDELDVVQISEPVRIVHHHSLALAELNKAAHLLFKALAVVVDLLRGHHGPQIAPARGIPDHTRAAPHQGDGPVARHLQTLHQAKRHEMSHMEAVCRGIKTDIESRFSIIDQFLDLLLVRQLGQQPSGF